MSLRTITLAIAILALFVAAVATAELAAAAIQTPERRFDTSCKATPFTYDGLQRAEPIKGHRLGWYNCTGTMSFYNPVDGVLVSHLNVPPTVLSTLYVKSCGCWVTKMEGTNSVTYEYGLGSARMSNQGTCFDLHWPEMDGSVTTLVGFAKNIDYHHRDLIYLLPETSAMWGHQSYYRGPNNSETVLIRKLDPNTGAITFMQSLICQQIRAQTGPGDETL